MGNENVATWLQEEVEPKLDTIMHWDATRKPMRIDVELMAEVVRAAIQPFHFWMQERVSPAENANGVHSPGVFDEAVMRALEAKHKILFESAGGKAVAVPLGYMTPLDFRTTADALRPYGYRYARAGESPTGKGAFVKAA